MVKRENVTKAFTSPSTIHLPEQQQNNNDILVEQ